MVQYWTSNDSSLRIMSLDLSQVGFGVLAGLLNIVGLSMKTLAYQNEKSGLITLIGYIGLVYAVIGDTVFLGE